MKLMLSLLFLLSSLTAWSQEILMANITSDIDRNRTEFLMETVNNEKIDGIRIKSYTPSGRIFEDFSHPSERIIQAGGVVLNERNGHQAVKLKVAKEFSLTEGGTVYLDYLYSGITGGRFLLPLKLVKKDGRFVLQKNNGEAVNHFYFKANRHPILGVVGIREIVLTQELLFAENE